MSAREREYGDCRACRSQVLRRDVIRWGTAGAMTMMLGQLFPGRVLGASERTAVVLRRHPRRAVATLSELEIDKPRFFNYPSDADLTDAMLIRLARRAGGGIGPQQDIVAFSAYCTHMGGSLAGGYLAKYKLLGCGEHLTTFDLTRHGLVVAGHATQALPQIVLELDGDTVYATGVVGLLYGYHDNLTDGS